MKDIILIISLVSSFLYAEIDERKSDVYFANGIDTSSSAADISLQDIHDNMQYSFSQAYNSIRTWDVVYNHTHGIGIDLYESMIQKVYEDAPGNSIVPFIWNANSIAGLFKYTFKGVVTKVAKKVPKQVISDYAAKASKSLAKKVVSVYNKKYGKKFTQEQIELMFNEVFDYLIEESVKSYVSKTEAEILAQEQADVQKHFNKYTQSIKDGHGVIVVAHSQGNLFTNRAYNEFGASSNIRKDRWMQGYINAIGIASPANNILGQSFPYMTFDNDMIQLVPDSLSTNVTNPKRYEFTNAVGNKIETLYSVEAHSFLSSYMATTITRNSILGFIDGAVVQHKNAPSQWKPKQSKTCGTTYCKEKAVAVTHMFDSVHMDKHLGNAPVYPFNKMSGKLYKVAGKYVLASLGAETIVEDPRDGVCYEITETLEHIDGKKKDNNNSSGNGNSFTVNEGIIETTIAWNYELDIDMDLDMSGPNVHHDVKDVPDAGLEHAYVEDYFDIKPGDIFELRAAGKKLANSQLEEECLDTEPVSIYAVVKTPSGSRFKQDQVQRVIFYYI